MGVCGSSGRHFWHENPTKAVRLVTRGQTVPGHIFRAFTGTPTGRAASIRQNLPLGFLRIGNYLMQGLLFIQNNDIKLHQFRIGFRRDIMVALNKQSLAVRLDQCGTFAELRRLDSDVLPHLVDPDQMFIEPGRRGWRHLRSARGA
jgi:hypothetical protein